MYYADTRSLNFAIENLCENEIISLTVLACSYGVQEEPFKREKNGLLAIALFANFTLFVPRLKDGLLSVPGLYATFFFTIFGEMPGLEPKMLVCLTNRHISNSQRLLTLLYIPEYVFLPACSLQVGKIFENRHMAADQ